MTKKFTLQSVENYLKTFFQQKTKFLQKGHQKELVERQETGVKNNGY